MMGRIIYLDGRFVAEEDALISVFDHGFLYGDAVYEGMRCHEGKVFRLAEHLKRLYESAKTIRLEIPFSIEEFQELHLEAIRRNNFQNAYIRTIVSRGYGHLGMDPRKCPRPTVVIIPSDIHIYPRELYETGMSVIIPSTRKSRPDSLTHRVKTTSNFVNIMAKMAASRQGFAEAVMLSSEGYVADATVDNVFIIKDGELLTPPKHVGIIAGITRNAILKMAKELGFSAREEILLPQDLYNADECFLTGTAAGIMPVVRVDERVIGNGHPGDLTHQLMIAYWELVKRDGVPVYTK